MQNIYVIQCADVFRSMVALCSYLSMSLPRSRDAVLFAASVLEINFIGITLENCRTNKNVKIKNREREQF